MYSRTDRKGTRIKVRKRIRAKVAGTAARPRLAVFRSSKHIYAQAIDDAHGQTVASASTLDEECRGKLQGASTCGVPAARCVGEAIAARLSTKGVTSVVFDRGGFRYHGRVKALADAAREHGLTF
ncbi:MAG: 50S ribosomal protein L18 [Acidobacteriota bacterium]|nr:50S ribosomal protein L18 [Acidobacteriota bacterium]